MSDEARALYEKLHTPNHYLDAIDIATLAAALRAAHAKGLEEGAVVCEKRAEFYNATREVDSFTRAIQINEADGCLEAIKARAAQVMKGEEHE